MVSDSFTRQDRGFKGRYTCARKSALRADMRTRFFIFFGVTKNLNSILPGKCQCLKYAACDWGTTATWFSWDQVREQNYSDVRGMDVELYSQDLRRS